MRGKNLNCGIRGGLWDEAHLERMGAAVWLFGWLVHRQTRERDGVGLVLGGSALTYAMIQSDTGYSRRTLQRWMAELRRGGYVRVRRTCHSRMIIEVLKAKKFGAKQLGFPQANFFASNSSAPSMAQKRASSAPYVAQKNAGWTRQVAAGAGSYAAGRASNRQYKPERQIYNGAHGGNFRSGVEQTAEMNPAINFSPTQAKTEEKANAQGGNAREGPARQRFSQDRCDNRASPRPYVPSDAFRFRQDERAWREAKLRAELFVGAGPEVQHPPKAGRET
ncbi:MAG TPA: hypothetical protein VGU63_12855 [Candidatus Acidoferrales bacterium]|nr:hypothetical protein [Candidatus Acidoferrales bacterium]